ncbi:3-hydroxyacyl-ACP dehydratase FabZ family protein [Lichenicoccus sp.]|uniref:3-hydroxyacyl-ACP dehydratase FabZ family protein n=1 Tax=Lichenicoccus sp. TaxID=2781899 RepID=UPI003D0A33B8
MTEAAFTIAADHPSLPGHFPGRPIVPGVVLLDHALAVIAAAHPGQAICAVRGVRFRRPVRPGTTLIVQCRPATRGGIEFTAADADGPVLSGIANLSDHPPV